MQTNTDTNPVFNRLIKIFFNGFRILFHSRSEKNFKRLKDFISH